MVAGRRGRNLIIAGCGAVALVALAGAAVAHYTGSQIPGPGVCKKVVYPSAHYAINADGVRVAHATAATGTVTEFSIGGSLIPVITPPSTFNVMTASQRQLRVFGLPPRPGTGPALATWEQAFARPGHTWYTPRWMCEGKNTNAPSIQGGALHP